MFYDNSSIAFHAYDFFILFVFKIMDVSPNYSYFNNFNVILKMLVRAFSCIIFNIRQVVRIIIYLVHILLLKCSLTTANLIRMSEKIKFLFHLFTRILQYCLINYNSIICIPLYLYNNIIILKHVVSYFTITVYKIIILFLHFVFTLIHP